VPTFCICFGHVHRSPRQCYRLFSLGQSTPPFLLPNHNCYIVSQAFSTTPHRASDLAKLLLIGHLVKDPESRLTKHDKEYFTWVDAATLTKFLKLIIPIKLHCSNQKRVPSAWCERRCERFPSPKIFLIQFLERRSSSSTFHRILSFHEGSNKYLRTLKKGSKVYVETAFEIREAEPEADPSTPQGQRQIFLRHGELRCNAFFRGSLSFRDFRINQGPELSKAWYPRRSSRSLKFLLKTVLAFHPILPLFCSSLLMKYSGSRSNSLGPCGCGNHS